MPQGLSSPVRQKARPTNVCRKAVWSLPSPGTGWAKYRLPQGLTCFAHPALKKCPPPLAARRRLFAKDQGMNDIDVLTQMVRKLAESRRDRPVSAGHYLALKQALAALTQALAAEPAADVRERALDVATAALRIATDGCRAMDGYRAMAGLDALDPQAGPGVRNGKSR